VGAADRHGRGREAARRCDLAESGTLKERAMADYDHNGEPIAAGQDLGGAKAWCHVMYALHAFSAFGGLLGSTTIIGGFFSWRRSSPSYQLRDARQRSVPGSNPTGAGSCAPSCGGVRGRHVLFFTLPFRWRWSLGVLSLWLLYRGPAGSCPPALHARSPARHRGVSMNRCFILLAAGIVFPHWHRPAVSCPDLAGGPGGACRAKRSSTTSTAFAATTARARTWIPRATRTTAR
jgi:hypothetical protein